MMNLMIFCLAKYLKVAIGKGLIDVDTLESLIKLYSKFLSNI